MQWNDCAIILSARKLGENATIVHLISPEQGMYRGVDRGGNGKRKRGVYQPGNLVMARWNARLSEHIGSLDAELLEPIAAHVLDNRHKLAGLSAAVTLVERTLMEREHEPLVYARLSHFMQTLRENGQWLFAYTLLEHALLQHTGFGLDLETCAATGQKHDLIYVSPKTGRAVCREAGLPYHDKLLHLPPFMMQSEASDVIAAQDILAGLKISGYFLEQRIFAPHGKPLPAARARFVDMLAT